MDIIVTTNQGGDNLFVIERDKVLTGDSTASIQSFDTPSHGYSWICISSNFRYR